MLSQLKLVQPTSVAEASKALVDSGEKAKIYAGGAELLLLLRNGLMEAEKLATLRDYLLPRLLSGKFRHASDVAAAAQPIVPRASRKEATV